jgi:uncharacterized delta-60 repeat protein
MTFSSIMQDAALLGILIFSTEAYTADGDLDPLFGDAGMVWTNAQAVYGSPVLALQDDGRIVVCDSVRQTKTGRDLRIARFNEDGSPDLTFGAGGWVIQSIDDESSDEHCYAIVVQSDGRVVLAGTRIFHEVPLNYWTFAVVRLMPNGDLDRSFGAGMGLSIMGLGAAEAVTLDSQNRIVAAGFTPSKDGYSDFNVVRLMSDGTPDATFNGSGQLTIALPEEPSNNRATGVAIDSQDRIVLAGRAHNSSALVRLLPDGTLDPTFGDGGERVWDGIGPSEGFIIDHAGRYVIAGGTGDGATNEDFEIARFLPDGSLDKTFGMGGAVRVRIDLMVNGEDSAVDVDEQPDGKLVAVGYALYGDLDAGYPMKAVAIRVDADGVIDPSFGVGGRSVLSFGPSPKYSQTLTSAAVDSAGRVVAAGGVWTVTTLPFIDDVLVRFKNDEIFANGFDLD